MKQANIPLLYIELVVSHLVTYVVNEVELILKELHVQSVDLDLCFIVRVVRCEICGKADLQRDYKMVILLLTRSYDIGSIWFFRLFLFLLRRFASVFEYAQPIYHQFLINGEIRLLRSVKEIFIPLFVRCYHIEF